MRLAHAGVPSVRPRSILLGGGTVVGRREWRQRLERLLTSAGDVPAVAIGAGVEDPAFVGTRSYTSADELRQWAGLLRGFSAVTVRGPRSAELLADVGLDVVVVGDPALAIEPDGGRPLTPSPGIVGVNVALPEDVHGGDKQAVVQVVTGAVARLVEAGHEVRLLPMHPDDVAASRALVAALPESDRARVRLVPVPRAPHDMVRLLGECEVVVGQRLHTVVLAAAAGVPALAVSYRPKCRDFMLSLERPQWALPSSGLQPQAVADAVSELVADRAEQAAHLAQRVGELRRRLRAAAATSLPALTG